MNRFGVDLALDCYDCDSKAMDDVAIGYKFLEDAVNTLGVHIMAPPFVFRAPEGYVNSGGTSGFVPIIESLVQYHALTGKNFVSINYYTCSEVDETIKENLIQLAKKTFGSNDIVVKFTIRGERYGD